MQAQLNQSRETWQGLERHILEEAIKSDSFHAQVFTACVLSEDDPAREEYPKIQAVLGFCQFSRRGVERVRAEWKLASRRTYGG